MSKIDELRERLEQAFAPTELTVTDDSEAHRGHAGWQEGGETHFSVRIRADGFAGQSRIQRHRAVHTALGKELVARIHALALDIGPPLIADPGFGHARPGMQLTGTHKTGRR